MKRSLLILLLGSVALADNSGGKYLPGTPMTAADIGVTATCGAGEYLTSNGTAVSCSTPSGEAGSGKAMFVGKSSASLTADISCSPAGYDVCAAASGVNQVPLPFSGTLRNLYLYMVTAPANGSSCKLLVRYGACTTGTLADSALTCTVVGNGSLLTCSNTSSTVAVTAGNCVQLFYDETGTCSGVIKWGFELTP